MIEGKLAVLKDSGAIEPAQPAAVGALVQYAAGSIVSRTLTKGKSGTMTVFAFDAGQGLSEHTAPFDAYVQVVEGEGELVIGGRAVVARAGEIVLMPANVPHAVNANVRFKMLLVMIRNQEGGSG